MNNKIGAYIDKKLEEKGMTKKELHNKLKLEFYSDKDYIKYKGFAARFYSKLYATDLMEISSVLDIDLNEMRDFLLGKSREDDYIDMDSVLTKSRYVSKHFPFDKWTCIEGDILYIVWYRQTVVGSLIVQVEMYNRKDDEMYDISHLDYLSVMRMTKDWEFKTFEEKMQSVKDLNKKFHDEIYV